MRQCYLVVMFVAACFSLVGCANTLIMTYTCDPSGATLHEVGTNKNVGTCPTTLKYTLREQDKANGYVVLKGMTADWVSGASTTVPTIRSDLSLGMNQQFHFDRPRDVPGYEADANYALNLQRNAIMAAQLKQAKDQAALDAAAATFQRQPPPTPAYPTNCTTVPIGNTIQTHCY